METCSTCRFWGPPTPPGWHQEADDLKFCRRAHSDDSRMQVTANDDWMLELKTTPDFGCVEHQPR